MYTPIVNKFNENEIDFDLSKIQTTPNTFNANQLIYWGQLEGKGNAVVENLFKLVSWKVKILGI